MSDRITRNSLFSSHVKICRREQIDSMTVTVEDQLLSCISASSLFHATNRAACTGCQPVCLLWPPCGNCIACSWNWNYQILIVLDFGLFFQVLFITVFQISISIWNQFILKAENFFQYSIFFKKYFNSVWVYLKSYWTESYYKENSNINTEEPI